MALLGGTPLDDVRDELEGILADLGQLAGGHAAGLAALTERTERCAIGTVAGVDAWQALPVGTGEALVVDDTAADPRLHDHPLAAAGLRRVLAVPVHVDGVRIATVVCGDRAPGPTPPDTLQRVRHLVRHVELLLEVAYQRQQHHQLRTRHGRVVAATGVGVWEVDEEGRTLAANEALAELLGVPLEELPGRSMFDFVPEEERSRVRARRRERLAGRSEVHPSRFVRPDGEVRHAVTSAAPLVAPDGRIRGASAIIVDVTDQVRATEELAESQRQLSALVEHLPGVSYVCDDDENYTIRYVSPGSARLFGYEPDELVGRGFVELTHPDDVEGVFRDVRAALAQGTPYNLTYRMRDRSGAYCWIWEQGAPAPGTGLLEGLMLDVSDTVAATEQLRASEERHRRLAEHLDDLVLIVTGGRVTFANPAAHRALAMAPGELVGRRFRDLVHLEDRAHVDAQHRRARRRGDGASVLGEYRLVATDGELVEVRARATVVVASAEPALHVVAEDLGAQRALERYRTGVHRLLTRSVRGHTRVQLDRELVALAAERLRRRCLTLASIEDGRLRVVASSADGPTRRAIDGARVATARLPVRAVVDAGDAIELEAETTSGIGWFVAARRGPGRDPTEVVLLHGPAHLPATAGDRELVGDVVAVADAIDAALPSASAESSVDDVTGLPDRRALVRHLSEVLATSPPGVAVACLGLDGFRHVDATFGSAVGDLLLRRVGERLGAALRPGEYLARLAGDAFVAVDPDGATGDAADLVGRLRLTLRAPLEVGDERIAVTAGVGVADSVTAGDDAEELLASAELAMHQAKRGGADRTAWFEDRLRERSRQRLTLEVEIRSGLARAEFVPYYQPRVRLADGAIVGSEALARWERSDGRVALPGDFVPVAEDSHLIEELGEAILRAACTDAAGWRAQLGQGLAVSVNVSARQLGDARFAELVAGVLADTGLPPDLLRLEITETAVLADLGHAVELLEELTRIGVTLSLDDYGSGYSSPALLRRLPLAEMKIDRAFVAELPADPDLQVLVRGICTIAAGLGLDAVAEGVETEEHAAMLHRFGCPLAQGYLWSPAIPAAAFGELIARPEPPWGRPGNGQVVSRR